MPTYELICLLKKMDTAALKTALTRSAKYILETGGTLRKMENLGYNKTPLKIKKRGMPTQNFAHYFLFHYDAGMEENTVILDKFFRDLDVIKSKSYVESWTPGGDLKEPEKHECTIYYDLLPPPYRPSVKSLLEISEKRNLKNEKYKFKYNSGLTYDPMF